VAARTALRSLAERASILPEYVDIRGKRRSTRDETRVALLAAMGIEASSEAAASRALAELDESAARRLLDAARVQRVDDRRPLRVRVPPALAGRQVEFALSVEGEDGASGTLAGRRRLRRGAKHASFPLPPLHDPGYYRLRLQLAGGGEDVAGEQLWVAHPGQCVRVSELLGRRRGFGVWTHVYALRSARDWGIGDLSDLGELVAWAGEQGAAFVGLNPLHALHNRGYDISPYAPLSRLFHNVIYLDVSAVPELNESREARSRLGSTAFREALAKLQAVRHVDYDAVLALKEPLLAQLHSTFARLHRDRESARGRAYAAFLERKGDALSDFASFLVLHRHFAATGRADPRAWPRSYRDPRSAAVRAFRDEHFEEFDRHRYLQFELDRQLGNAARRAALPIGLYGDLAIGTAAGGSDPWAFPGLFLDGANVGAPPDDYSAEGQDWGLPPVDPRRLGEDAYRYWILVVQNALEHMGALRIDHVMGLFRQYWVPSGLGATEGAYVRYPSRDLLGILALESQRRGALIVGEDLGTVPRALPSVMERWGILSSRVLYFQRDRAGNFRSSRSYPKRALVTANTHDHPPLAGFWEGRDLELRRQVGHIASDEELARLEADRRRERRALVRRLSSEGCLDEAVAPRGYPELCSAVHRFLSRTAAPLVGLWLDDLVGETDPVNIPGIGIDRYPSWSRRIEPNLESLREDGEVGRAVAPVAARKLHS
jgi:4-alpha-glucanotransferase